MGKKYVQEGVFLVCDKGTTISRLNNLHYQEITLFNNTFATRKDKKLFVNFDMFGSCSTCNGCPCTAPVTDWTNITDGITIDGNELLLENSELPCAKGGNIKIFYTKQSATDALPKKKKSFWDFLSDGANTYFSFTKGFYKGLWKGLKGTVTAVVDLAVWASKHHPIYALANPVGYAKQLQKDAEMIKKLGNVAKKAGTWVYRNSAINMIANPNDYFLAQAENAQMMGKLVDKASNMSAEDWGDFTGQVVFEVILEVGTAGGGAALTATKVADKGLDVVKAVDKLDDVSDALKTAEKLEDISDGVKTMENLNNGKPLELGDVIYQADDVVEQGLKKSIFEADEVLGRKVFKNSRDIVPGKPSFVDDSVHKSIRDKINDGWTNKDLMEAGNAPIGPDGKQINLHHLIGKEPGTMVELTSSFHKQHHKPLHGLIEKGKSFRNDPKLQYQYEKFRKNYWRERAKDF